MSALPPLNADVMFVHSEDIIICAILENPHRVNCTTVVSRDGIPCLMLNVAECH